MTDQRLDDLVREATRMRYSRRGIMKRASALGLSAAAANAAVIQSGKAAPKRGQAPSVRQNRTISILAGTYFVPEAQEFFDQQATEWGTQLGVTVQTDYINWPDIQARIAAAVEGGSGPDVIEMRDVWPNLYFENMVPVDDLANAVGESYGGYFDWVTSSVAVDGKWFSVPVGASSAAFAYRMSYFQEAGLADPKVFPATWDELFAIGANLKEMGKPLGQALGQSTGDPPGFAYAYMWANGAMEREEDGKTIAFNTPEFVEGMQKFVDAWPLAFDDTGLAWDDSANNRAFLSDQIAGTINGSSIYIEAQKAKRGASTADYEVVVDPADIWHATLPAGPSGPFVQLGSWSYAAMTYSPEQEAALEFITWWTERDHFVPWLEAQQGYIIPMGPGLTDLEVFTGDPALAPYATVAEIARNKGYAGPADQKAAQVSSLYIITNTFAEAIQSGDAQAAIENGAAQLQRIYGR